MIPELTWRKQVVDDGIYLQRHLLLIQRTNQLWVNMGPLLLHKALLPVLPDINHTDTHARRYSKHT